MTAGKSRRFKPTERSDARKVANGNAGGAIIRLSIGWGDKLDFFKLADALRALNRLEKWPDQVVRRFNLRRCSSTFVKVKKIG